MPGLTPQEKEELFQQAKTFADICRERQGQLSPQFRLIHYATDEEIRQNLENPEFVNNYLKDAIDDDYSDLEGALESKSQGLDFYQKHAPKLTGFFSGEHLTQGLGLNDTTQKHFQNLRPFFTTTWAFFNQMKFTASFVNFVVTDIPPKDFSEYGAYMSLMFPKTDHPYRTYFEGIHSINDLNLMKDQIKRYKDLGGDLGPGFLRDFEVVDKDGHPVSITSKPLEELRLQKLSNEKRNDLSKIFTSEVYEAQVKRSVRVARQPLKNQNPLDNQLLPPYKRDEALIEQKRNQLAEAVRSFHQKNRFFRFFAFGQKQEIRNYMKEMKEVGATDLEVKLTRKEGILSKKQYRNFLSSLRKSSLGDDVKNPKPTCAADKEFAVDIRCLKNATVKGVDAEQIMREVGLIELEKQGPTNEMTKTETKEEMIKE